MTPIIRDNVKLTLNKAESVQSVLVLGTLTVKQLRGRGVCSYFVNLQGEVELAHPVEFAMDYLPEDQALRILLHQHKYTDEQLMAYLKGREARSPRGEGDTNAENL